MPPVYAVSVDGVMYAIRYSPLGLPMENAIFLPGIRTPATGTRLHRWDPDAAAYTPIPLWPRALWWLRLVTTAHVRSKGTRDEPMANFRATSRVLAAWLRRTTGPERIGFFASPSKGGVLTPLRRAPVGDRRPLVRGALHLLDWARRAAPDLLDPCGGGPDGDPTALAYCDQGAVTELRAILGAPHLPPFAQTYQNVRDLLLGRCGARLDDLLLSPASTAATHIVPLIPIDVRARLPPCVDCIGVRCYPAPLDCSLAIRTDHPLDDEERFCLAATPRETPWRAFLGALYALCRGECPATVAFLDAGTASRRAAYAPLRATDFPHRDGVLWLSPDRATARNLRDELDGASVVVVDTFSVAPPLPLVAIVVEAAHALAPRDLASLLRRLCAHAAAAAAAGGPPLIVVLAGDRRSPYSASDGPWAAGADCGEADGGGAQLADLLLLPRSGSREGGLVRLGGPTGASPLAVPRVTYHACRSADLAAVLGEVNSPVTLHTPDTVYLAESAPDLRRAARTLPPPGPVLPHGVLLADGTPAYEGDRIRCVHAGNLKAARTEAVYRIGGWTPSRTAKQPPRIKLTTDVRWGGADAVPVDSLAVTPGQLAHGFESARFLTLDQAAHVHFAQRPVVALLTVTTPERRARWWSTLTGIGVKVTIVTNDRAWVTDPAAPDPAAPEPAPLWRDAFAPLALEKE